MNAKSLVGMVTVVALSAALAELLLQPRGSDRGQLLMILVAPALVALLVTPLLTRWTSRRTSVAGVALTVGLCSLALGAASSSAASNAMFLSSHDYRLFLVVLLLSSGISLIVGAQLARPLAVDVRRLGDVAGQVSAGNLDINTGITRNDEVGKTATAVDQMVVALRQAEADRQRILQGRHLLFTSIGHDLRTPLAAMRAAVDGLEDGIATDPKRYLARLSIQIRDLDSMVDQLIELARLESGHRVMPHDRVSLAELVDEAAESLTPLAARQRQTITVVSNGPAIVTGNAEELSRVARNLIDNAVRHNIDGGEIRVTITSIDQGVDLVVADQGQGFPAAFVALAFDPFTRADVARSTTTGRAGLGLAICRAIVDAHSGSISILEPPGGRVRVSLPTAISTSTSQSATENHQ